jgi:hypothetical protein
MKPNSTSVRLGLSVPDRNDMFLMNWKNTADIINASRFLFYYIAQIPYPVLPISVLSSTTSNNILFCIRYVLLAPRERQREEEYAMKFERALYRFSLSLFFRKFECYLWRQYGYLSEIAGFDYCSLFFNQFFIEDFQQLVTPRDYRYTLFSFLSFFYKDADLLTYLIAVLLRRHRYHNRTLNFLSDLFASSFDLNSRVTSALIRISGRLNNHDRTVVRVFQFGPEINFCKFSLPITYGYRVCVTPIGVFGIRV